MFDKVLLKKFHELTWETYCMQIMIMLIQNRNQMVRNLDAAYEQFCKISLNTQWDELSENNLNVVYICF
jgi:hypothetical protein